VPNNSPAVWGTNNATLSNAGQVIKANLSNGHASGLVFQQIPNATPTTSFQPTLAELNSEEGIKMEAVDLDLDDIGNFFMKNSSPNVTLGVGPTKVTPGQQAVSASGQMTHLRQASSQPANSNFSNTYWSEGPNPWSSMATSSNVGTVPTSNSSYNISPLSDILTDLSSNSTLGSNQSLSPNLPSHSPSQAGPTRTSTVMLHI
jgi:hypothetical protein